MNYPAFAKTADDLAKVRSPDEDVRRQLFDAVRRAEQESEQKRRSTSLQGLETRWQIAFLVPQTDVSEMPGARQFRQSMYLISPLAEYISEAVIATTGG